jgi:hypothetical protein
MLQLCQLDFFRWKFKFGCLNSRSHFKAQRCSVIPHIAVEPISPEKMDSKICL